MWEKGRNLLKETHLLQLLFFPPGTVANIVQRQQIDCKAKNREILRKVLFRLHTHLMQKNLIGHTRRSVDSGAPASAEFKMPLEIKFTC
jgi:hypothetical protein